LEIQLLVKIYLDFCNLNFVGNIIGRRFTNALAFAAAFIACIPIILTIKDPEYEMIPVALSVFIKFCISINFFVVNLQSMETYPTCLRQTGISFGGIVGSSLGVLGPYIVYLVSYYFRL
jgi:OCT family organic cation transporter-like MFS transporter 4/5